MMNAYFGRPASVRPTNRVRILAVSLLIWGLAGMISAQTAKPVEPSTIAAIDTHLKALEQRGFAGSVLIAEGDRPLLEKGYGLADRKRQLPWTPRTVSTTGSITKQFTAAAIALLADEGRLKTTDTLSKHFSAVPEDKRDITLHHLLTHSSGIVDLAGASDSDKIGRDEFVRRALAQDLKFQPGESYAYSNAGYSLLAAIIEQQSGMPYERFLRQRLFEPAGMYETGYVLPGWNPDLVARGYRDGKDAGTVLEFPMAEDGPYWVLRGNGGIHTTAYDMLRWARSLLAGRVLSKSTLEKLWTPYQDEGGGSSFYGYGWVVLDVRGTRVLTHNGGNPFYFADLAIVPDRDLFIFLQTNVFADQPQADRLLGSMLGALLQGRPMPDLDQ